MFRRVPPDMFSFTTTERADLNIAIMHLFSLASERLATALTFDEVLGGLPETRDSRGWAHSRHRRDAVAGRSSSTVHPALRRGPLDPHQCRRRARREFVPGLVRRGRIPRDVRSRGDPNPTSVHCDGIRMTPEWVSCSHLAGQRRIQRSGGALRTVPAEKRSPDVLRRPLSDVPGTCIRVVRPGRLCGAVVPVRAYQPARVRRRRALVEWLATGRDPVLRAASRGDRILARVRPRDAELVIEKLGAKRRVECHPSTWGSATTSGHTAPALTPESPSVAAGVSSTAVPSFTSSSR